MLTQASIEALRMRFDASMLDGSEAIYASRHGENDIAFVAIAPNGKITTYKNDSYPEELLEQEIMTLCCAKYDDKSIHIPMEPNDNQSFEESSGYSHGILIELAVTLIALILCAIFLLIYWILLKDFGNTIIIGGVICLPVLFFAVTVIMARRKGGGK